MYNFRYALRVLARSPGFTFVAVVALALGIGANTAIFSVINAVFLRPLPYPDAGRLVEISESSGGGRMSVSYPNFVDWQQQADVFEHMAASGIYDGTLSGRGSAERIPINYVSPGFFSVFRTKPLLGRDFTAQDDRDGATPVVLLTHPLWQSRFGSNPAVLGSSLTIDEKAYTIIGVLPADYCFYRSAEAFIPISNVVTRRLLHLRENHNNMYVVARLKPGVTLEKAQVQMGAIARRLEQAYPGVNTSVGSRVVDLRETVAGDSRQPAMMLAGAVCLVLLIACVNVANLLLARAADRRKEIAVRAALGASRTQVIRQLLSESLLLAAAGGALGMLLARWSFAGLVRLVPASIAAGGLSIDFRVLGFTVLICVLTGVLFGLVPALDAARLDLSGAMRDGTRTTGASSRGRLRDALVVSEVALALVLLVGAGLLLRTLNWLSKVPLGFETENMLTMRMSLPDSDDFAAEQASMFFDRLIDRAKALPGVDSAGAISHMPLSGFFASAAFYREDRPVPPRGQLPSGDQRVASPGYFGTMRIPLLRGRLFTAADGRIPNIRRAEAMPWLLKSTFAVVINQTMARRFWPGEDPVGKSFRFGFPEMHGPKLVIVGVVGDTRDYGPDTDASPTWYFSGYHFPRQAVTLVMRTRTEPAALVSAVRRATVELSPSALVSNVTTAEQLVSNAVGPWRLNMLLLAIFAGIALLLATIGIYGVMAYAVNRQRREIGLRMALGAARGDVLKLVIGKAVILGALGVVIGSAAALGLTRLIASMLFGVKPADPVTFTCVAALLFAVAVGASYAPALRATRVSPLTALRCE